MNNISVFEFESNEVRFVDGKPVANDVAKTLGYADPSKTISTKVKPKNKSVTKMVTVDGKLRDVTVLEEAGIYQLIFGSKLPSAEKFQDWVFNDVLPSIRKTGNYSVKPQHKILGAYTERVECMMLDCNKIPHGYWCVLHESSNLLIYVETVLKLPINKSDLLDGSIGITWSNHRKDKSWAGDRVKYFYRFPDGRPCQPWCYQMRELEHFRYFLEDTYRPILMPRYLEDKYPNLVHI